jgi:PCFT/HCP family folate transporter-like MFS transporter 1/3
MQELKSKERKRVEMNGKSNFNEETIGIGNRENKKNEEEKRHPIRMLFDLSNMKEMYFCAIKKRPNKVRKQIWLLYGIMIITIISYRANSINFQFVQKIYYWDAEFYASISSISMIVHTIATLTIVPFLIKVVKLNDIPLAIVGSSVAVLKDTIMGTWLTSNGYYLSVAVGSISGLAMIGKKAYISKIIAIDELGKIYGFMSVLDTLAPFAASFVMTYLFKYTINSYPSAIYQLLGALGLIPVCILIWIDLCCKRPDENNNKNKYETNIMSDNGIKSQEGDLRL